MRIHCPHAAPVGTLVYGSNQYAYIVAECDGVRGLRAIAWSTDADRKPLSGELERVLRLAARESTAMIPFTSLLTSSETTE